MGSIPQVYPLWLAEVRDSEIYAGRVVGWRLGTMIDGLPGSPEATPLVAFTTPDGLLLETGTPHSALVFLGDTREEAVAAARRVAGSPAGFPPVAPEEDDDPRTPDPRTRVHNPRRLSVSDLGEEPLEADPGTAGPLTGRTVRHER